MNKITKILSLCLLPASVALGSVSCIKEGQWDCPPPMEDHNVRVVVKLPAGSPKSYYDFEVECVDLYVFNEDNGKYVDGYEQKYDTSTETEFFFDLPAGNYRFVAWTNHCTSYELSHSREESSQQGTSYRDMVLSFLCNEDRIISEDMPDLLFGHLTNARIENVTNQDLVVQTIPFNNIINLTLEGLTAPDEGYSLSVFDDNSHYTFDNNYVPYDQVSDRTLEYKRAFTADGPHMQRSSMKVLRLTDPDIYTDKVNPIIRITDNATGESIYDEDLIDIIKKAYLDQSQELDFDLETVFDIVLKFDTNMQATVSVNGWNASDQPGELE